ncbi:MFS transporter [Rhizobium sp. A37_96]
MRRYLIYAGLFVLMMVNYIDRVNMSVAIGPLAKEFNLTPVEIGYLFSVAVWSYAILLIPLGMAVDKWGVRRVTGISVTIWSLAGILTGAATTMPLLLFSRLLLGAGECATYPAGGRVVSEWAPKSERGIATAFLNCGAYAGPAVGAVLVGLLVSYFGWRVSFYVTGIIGFAFGIICFFFYRQPEHATWLSVEERTRVLNERNDSDDSARISRLTASDSKGENGQIQRLKVLLGNQTIWALFMVEACITYTWSIFLTWLPSYIQFATGVDVMKTGFFTAVPFALATLFVLVLSWLSDQQVSWLGGKNRRVLLCATLILSSVILAAPLVTSTVAILSLVTISLTCVATAISLNITLTNDVLPDRSYAGLAVGFVILGGNIAGLLAPIVTGYIVGQSGNYSNAFIVSGVLMFIGAIISVLFMSRPVVLNEKAYA